MHDVTIRSRKDGIVELTPRVAPLDATDRLLVIVTVLLSAGGFYVSGAMPAEVLLAVVASCVVGEVFLALKFVALALLRPAAQVAELRPWARR